MSTRGQTWLSFSITPVQGFIEAARTVRDLAAGSRILSIMVEKAILAGGGTLLFPNLPVSGEPLCLPNRFVMTFPTQADAKTAETAARTAALDVWQTLADECRTILAGGWKAPQGWKPPVDWDPEGDWQRQVDSYWDIQIRIVDAVQADEATYRRLFDRTEGDPFHRHWGLLSTAADSAKQVRTYPGNHGAGRQKCSLMGELEQMGPAETPPRLAEWWQAQVGVRKDRARIGERDRLCAVSLVKRFAPVTPSAHDELKVWATDVQDTAMIATAGWRSLAERHLGDQWRKFADACKAINSKLDGADESVGRLLLADPLTRSALEKEYGALADAINGLVKDVGQKRKALLDAAMTIRVPNDKLMPEVSGDAEPVSTDTESTSAQPPRVILGPPPRYLCAIALDGDRMGKRLGRLGSTLAFNGLSERLQAFAARTKNIVEADPPGQHIYAGGDDLLALTHIWTALVRALELRAAFPEDLPGGENAQDTSTASMGIVLFHYKHDLRDALRQTRAAEQEAKTGGRNRAGIRLLKRSGGDIGVTAVYRDLEDIYTLGRLFREGSGFGWLAGLHALEEPLKASKSRLQIAAQIRAFTRHSEGLSDEAADVIERLLSGCEDRHRYDEDEARQPFDRFYKFVQTAAFLARGRE